MKWPLLPIMHAPLECSQPPIITLLDRGSTGVALKLRLGPFSQSKAFVDNLAQDFEVGNNGRDITNYVRRDCSICTADS